MSNSEFLYDTNDNYRAATDSRIAENRRKGNLARFEDQDLVAFLYNKSGFFGSLYDSIAKFGKLSEKQKACAYKAMKEEQQRINDLESKKSEWLESIDGLLKFQAEVVKGGKNGATVKVKDRWNKEKNITEWHPLSSEKTFKIEAINLRKGDSILIYTDLELSVIKLSLEPYVTRYNGYTRQAYNVDLKF